MKIAAKSNTIGVMWDYHKKDYVKQEKKDPVWKLERLINYGLGGKKLNAKLLEKYLPVLKIPPNRKAFLQLLLDEKKHSHARPKKRH